MSGKLGLLATLSALAAVGSAVSAQAADVQTQTAQIDPFAGLVSQLAASCLVEAPPGVFNVVTAPARIAVCCAVVRQVGVENMDFLQAVALGNRSDPRLTVLDTRLVDVLLSCRQEAIDRLAELAVLAVAPAAGPNNNVGGGNLYTG